MLRFPSCREVAEQLSEDIDNPLSGSKWLKMKLHLLICAYCRRYGEQIKLASDTVAQLDAGKQPDAETEQVVLDAFRDCHGRHHH